MTAGAVEDREAMWESRNEEFRDPAEIIGYPHLMKAADPKLLEYETRGKWWETLSDAGLTLLVTREYEHLLLALHADAKGGPEISALKMPHPSGLTVDRARGVVHVAATRNPNQIFDLVPIQELMPRLDVTDLGMNEKILVPVRARFLPGCLYIHDLAMIGGRLYANSVGQNAIVELPASGGHERVWWPKCVETDDGPIFGRNHLQLNSIAAGETVEASFFSASTDEITDLRPGDPAFPVDRRGVIFSGATGEPIARGLTRPHSARIWGNRVWVDNSGYGEVGFVEKGVFTVASRLPGWTRGLCFCDKVMFVGTSRVLPRFTSYAPGLDPKEGICGVHAVDVKSGEILGSIIWPYGSQIFAVEWVPKDFAAGFPFRPGNRPPGEREKALFYAFRMPELLED
jgi:uncharacterized protein (TIGR03032 family)